MKYKRLLVLATVVMSLVFGMASIVGATGGPACGLYDNCNPSSSQNASDALNPAVQSVPAQAYSSGTSSTPALQNQVTTPQAPSLSHSRFFIGVVVAGGALLLACASAIAALLLDKAGLISLRRLRR